MPATANPAALSATERDTTLNPRQLRSAGFVPATLYGKGLEPLSIQVKETEFVKLYNAGSRVFTLKGLPQEATAKAQDVQITPIKQEVLSIQFWVQGN